MKRLTRVFRDNLASGGASLIGYLTAGDPRPEYTVRYSEALIRGGVDVLELGVPFSDPIADGITIQASTQRALEAGTNMRDVFKIASALHSRYETPIVLLSYLNPIHRMGFRNFFEEAKACGVEGVVVPDLPVEESSEFRATAKDAGIATVFLASPTTSDQRLDKILRASTGFVYLVSLLGVTGVRSELSAEAHRLLERVRSRRDRPYVAVGFGVSTPQHVSTLARGGAEGVIVGSALVKIVQENLSEPEKCENRLEEFAKRLKEAARFKD